MGHLPFDIAHLLAGGLVLVSFMLLYQDRMSGLINIFALHAVVLSLSVGWQAYTQHAPHLFVTAAIAIIFKALIIPISLQRIVVRLEYIARSRSSAASASPCSSALVSSLCL